MAHRALRIALALLICLIGAACESQPKAGEPGAPSGTGTPADDYAAGNYTSAFRRSTRLAQSTRTGSEEWENHALTAGLSAQALDQPDVALQWLTPLLDSRRREISGRANAGVGLIEQSRGRHDRAAALLRTASDSLSGNDAARAAFHAGQSYAALGRADEARIQYAIAAAGASDPTLKAQARAALGGPVSMTGESLGSWTLQLGAFSSRLNAERALQSQMEASRKAGLGPPRIVERRSRDGRTVWAVHVGRFGSQEEARRVQSRFGGSAIVAAQP